MARKRILILTASYGDGHNAAARNVRDALQQLAPDTRVEVLDLLDSSYKALNAVLKRAYLGLVRYTPRLWGHVYHWIDRSNRMQAGYTSLNRLRRALSDIIHEAQPDCVVSTFPAYAQVIQELYRDHRERPFRLVTVVTDSISINSAWFRAPSDIYVVPNEATAAVLRTGGVPDGRIHPLGFPVSPRFAVEAVEPPPPVRGQPRQLLYILNTGRKKTGRLLDELLGIPNLHLTITAGRDAQLKARLLKRTADHADRVRVLGWTNQMPELLLRSHLVITKAGGAVVQEAIAARCPMLLNQVIPGQEEGNAELVRQGGLGAVVKHREDLVEYVRLAFANEGELWSQWRRNLQRISRPDAALRLAEMILAPEPTRRSPFTTPPAPADALQRRPRSLCNPTGSLPQASGPLLCDFHIHSNYSDGTLSVPELVDFYGQRRFSCICITDHLADPRRLIGRLSHLSGLVLSRSQYHEYFQVLRREADRAWQQYRMLLMTGVEFNKDGLTRKSSAHLLGLDLQSPIEPDLDLVETIEAIHAQQGLAVASHPHIMRSEWGKNTLYLWEHQNQFIPLLDAWEIGNRNNLFAPVGLKRLPYVANSDLHKPRHIYSWKTLLHCEKDPSAIKDCIRRNTHVSITLYRDPAEEPQAASPPSPALRPGLILPSFSLPAARG